MSGTYLFIRNNEPSGKVLDVYNDGKNPGDRVIIWNRKPSNANNQLWEFEGGFLINRNSGLVLEAPLENGELRPGTALVQAEKRHSDNDNQKWRYDRQYRLLNMFDESLCVWGRDGNVQDPGTSVVVDIAIEGEITQEWIFDDA